MPIDFNPATPTDKPMPLPSWTPLQIIAQLDTGLAWESPTISYSFPVDPGEIFGYDELAGFSTLTPRQQTYAELALQTWDDLIAPDFQQVAAGSDIEFGNSMTGVVYAHSYFPVLGSVWLNSGYGELSDPAVGNYGFTTYVHEIGHAIGLDHMGDYNGEGDWLPSCYEDSAVYSIMSYFGPNWGGGVANGEGLVAWADWLGRDGQLHDPQTPMVSDILAVQSIYGAETTTRTDDTTYGFNTTITGEMRAIFDFTSNLYPILTLYDAAGVDTLDLSGWSGNSTIDLAPGAYSSGNDMTYNLAIAYGCDIENAVGGAGDDAIYGNALVNLLVGGAGADQLFGAGGDDRLQGGGGSDYLAGGDGDDTVLMDGSWSSYSFTLVDGVLSFSSAITFETDRIVGVEHFSFADLTLDYEDLFTTPHLNPVYGDARANTLKGTAGGDLVGGLAGNDTLYGYAGDDTLDGGAGSDKMIGGAGDDTYVVDDARDKVSESADAGDDRVLSDVSWTLPNQVETLVLTGGAVNATGNKAANTLVGNDADNLLDGKAGIDAMAGGLGNDSYVVDLAEELGLIDEAADAGDDTLKIAYANQAKLALQISLDGALENVEHVVLAGKGLFDVAGSGADNALTGNASANGLAGAGGDDILLGLAGNDVLDGGDGDDLLAGGVGLDVLTGGAGSDLFRFDTALKAKTNLDQITDFVTAVDCIELENSVFTRLTAAGPLDARHFATGKAADADDYLVYDTATGALYYDADGSGSKAAVQFALLAGAPELAAGDFVVG